MGDTGIARPPAATVSRRSNQGMPQKIGQKIGHNIVYAPEKQLEIWLFLEQGSAEIKSIPFESPARIDPTRLLTYSEETGDLLVRLVAAATTLSEGLHPKTAAQLASLVRIMNAYYSNRIEGHHTRPKEIEDALANRFESDSQRRNLQIEAAAHVRVQALIDDAFTEAQHSEPASGSYLQWLHAEFFRHTPDAMLTIQNGPYVYNMLPGVWRAHTQQDNVVGRHVPPSSAVVDAFMQYFGEQYAFQKLGQGARILAIAAAHHRLAYIHPFPDGNGRVARLMSHAMAHEAGIGAHGLWSISRGLARGLVDQSEYMRMMDAADEPRRSDLDGRGNLSLKALEEFTNWFLEICLDQVIFMSKLFDLKHLTSRLTKYVEYNDSLHPATALLLTEAYERGEIARGDIPAMLGLPDRTARRIIAEAISLGIIDSSTPKGPVHLRFPTDMLEVVFPRLFT
jgi:Fic family protein